MPTSLSEASTLSSISLLADAPSPATLQRHVRSLVISPRLEVRKPLLRVLESLQVDVTCCSNRTEAEEVLSHLGFAVVFCDEHLPDGSYTDFIHANNFDQRIPRVIVATRAGEWDLYFEATGKGAFDVIRSPWYYTDVEMAVIRAMHEEEASRVA